MILRNEKWEMSLFTTTVQQQINDLRVQYELWDQVSNLIFIYCTVVEGGWKHHESGRRHSHLRK